MPRFFRLQVDVDAPTDELHAFVTDPRRTSSAGRTPSGPTGLV
jgi:hypothetical protein